MRRAVLSPSSPHGRSNESADGPVPRLRSTTPIASPTVSRATDSGGVTISDQVIASDELVSRLTVARAAVKSHQQPDPVDGSVADRASRLHILWSTVAPPTLTRAAGIRGWLGFNVKRVVRKLAAWYVEPRWNAQHEIDAELARFASTSSAAIQRLEHEVAHLHEWNMRLQRELVEMRREESRGTG